MEVFILGIVCNVMKVGELGFEDLGVGFGFFLGVI
jgi:hypothetical protein